MRTSLPALVLAAAATFTLAACDKDTLGTRLQLTPLTYSVSAGLNPVLSHTFTVPRVPTERDRFEAETGVAWDDWAGVRPARASLLINEGGLDWSFALEVTVNAYVGTDPRRRVEIFYRDQIPANVGARLDLVPGDLDVQELFSGEEVTVELELRRLLASPPQRLPVVLEWSLEGREEG